MFRRRGSVDFGVAKDQKLTFLPWEFVSLFRKSFTTLNLYMKKREDLMAFISVLAYHIYGEEVHRDFMSMTIKMQLKMKLAYSNWKRSMMTDQNVKKSIRKTLQEK